MKPGFFKFRADAIIPTKGTPEAVGWDIYSNEDCLIEFGEKCPPISTGIGSVIPEDCYGRLAPRSGMSVKGAFVNAGVVDRDYRGEIKVVMFNLLKEPLIIKKGERIAQFILEKVSYQNMEEIPHPQEENTHLGFGSTGI